MADIDHKGELEDCPAIIALNSLFKLTEIHFWVDLYTGMPYDSTPLECTKTAKDDVISLSSTENSSLSVDTELCKQMNELGLPLSFCINKEKRSGKVKGKRKDAHKKVFHTHEETRDEASNSFEVNEYKIASPAITHKIESLYCDLECGSVNNTVITNDDMAMEATTNDDMAMEATLKHVDGVTSSDMHVDDNGENLKDGCIEERLENHLVDNHCGTNAINNGSNDEFGDWIMYWDEFYGRNYYYNSRTHESTWEPPPGMEQLNSDFVSNESKEMMSKIEDEDDVCNIDSKEENSGVVLFNELSSDVISGEFYNEQVVEFEVHKATYGSILYDLPDVLDPLSGPSTIISDAVLNKRKKKVKRTRAHTRASVDNQDFQCEVSMEEISPVISKYWCQRYLLFSKYDEGIRMDEEGWFSATPECIARHHAFRCGNGIVVDCFTGVGGNAIRFAQNNTHIIAIDIDPKKIEYAQHNASIYGVKDLIEFITGDSFILAQKLKADTVFLSPPWGGPEYAKKRNFDITTMLKPHNGQFLFNVAKEIAPRIVMFLPRNVDMNQLAELSLSANPPWKLEVEKNFLNGKLKAITAYFTDPSLCDDDK